MTSVLAALLLAGSAHAAQRIALLPLVPEDGINLEEGWKLSESLLARWRGPAALVGVDWEDLGRMHEGRTPEIADLQDPRFLIALGRRLGVDQVVTGRYAREGGKAVARVRLFDVRKGSVSTARRWVAPLPEGSELALRDAPASEDCAGAAARVDALESRVLEVKARYWARRIKKGGLRSGETFTPGAVISDPALKSRFYGRLRSWYSLDAVPELTPAERFEYAEAEGKALGLARRCGIL